MYALTAIVYGYLSPDAIDHIQEGEEEGEKNEGVEKCPNPKLPLDDLDFGGWGIARWVSQRSECMMAYRVRRSR